MSDGCKLLWRENMDMLLLTEEKDAKPGASLMVLVGRQMELKRETWGWRHLYSMLGDTYKDMNMWRLKEMLSEYGFQSALNYEDVAYNAQGFFLAYHEEKGLLLKVMGHNGQVLKMYLYGEVVRPAIPEERWEEHLVGMDDVKLRASLARLGYTETEEDLSLVARHDERGVTMTIGRKKEEGRGVIVEHVTFEGDADQILLSKKEWETEVEWTNLHLPLAILDQNGWRPEEGANGFALLVYSGLFNKLASIESRGWRFNPQWETSFKLTHLEDLLRYDILDLKDKDLTDEERVEWLFDNMVEPARRIVGMRRGTWI